MKVKKKLALPWQILIGFAIGIALGMVFKENVLKIKVIGDIFMKLLKMLVMPLVFFSIIDGITGIKDTKKFRSISVKTFSYFIINTLIACVFGILLMKLFRPGAGVAIDYTVSGLYEETSVPGMSDTLLSFFPENIFQSLSNGSMIQVIVFALFFAVAVVAIGENASTVHNLVHECATVMYKVTDYVLALSPIGVCALMACSIGQYGIGIFGALSKFILADYAAQIIFAIVIYVPLIKFVAKVDVWTFLRKSVRYWIMAASTTSSVGTLPVTMEVTVNDLGVDPEIASFVLPLGCTMNMTGGALYDAAVITFAAQVYGMNLSLSQMFLLVATATLITIGSPGIPGGGVVVAVMLMTLLGMPLEIAGMIAGIYRLLDMAHTTMNVTGDAVVAACVARSENMINYPVK